MKFKGLIITDDMEMNAISKMMDIGVAAVKSVQAGADIVLVSTHGGSIEKITGAITEAVKTSEIPIEKINESVRRILEVKMRYGIMGLLKGGGDVRNESGATGFQEIKFSDKELKLLDRAGELNKEISRRSLYYYSSTKSPLITMNRRDYVKFMITSDRRLTDVAGKHGCILFRSLAEFIKLQKKGGKMLHSSSEAGNIPALLYYHVPEPDLDKIEKLMNEISQTEIKLMLLVTGNPFPLSGLSSVPDALFTFSSTDESIRQMAECLKGVFQPVTEINASLGFQE